MTATPPIAFDEMHGLGAEVLPHYKRYADWLEEAVQSGRSISETRKRVGERWRRVRLRRRLAKVTFESEAQRAEAARDAVTGLARRLVRGGEPA